MKVALLTNGIWPFVIGGMQKHSYLLSKYLTHNKVSVILFYPQMDENSRRNLREHFTDAERAQIEFVEVPKSKKYRIPGHYLYESYLFSKSIYRILKTKKDVDFIYAKGLTSWYALLKRKSDLPALGINIHGYEFAQRQVNFKERCNAFMLSIPFKFINRNADYIFSYGSKISDYIKRIGVSQDRIIEIPGAVEEGWILPEKKKISGKRKFLFLGRFERRKGVEEINKILNRIVHEYSFEFHFAGSIPACSQVNHPGVFYHDVLTSKEAIIKLLDSTHVLVCPSYSEGMPNVIMEAMARGCAIIATNVGAVSLLVGNDNGWLIKPADIASLREAIIEAINIDDMGIEEMSEISEEKIKHNYSWDLISKITYDKLEKIVSQNGQ